MEQEQSKKASIPTAPTHQQQLNAQKIKERVDQKLGHLH